MPDQGYGLVVQLSGFIGSLEEEAEEEALENLCNQPTRSLYDWISNSLINLVILPNDDHHHDDQEAQECPWNGHLEENMCVSLWELCR